MESRSSQSCAVGSDSCPFVPQPRTEPRTGAAIMHRFARAPLAFFLALAAALIAGQAFAQSTFLAVTTVATNIGRPFSVAVHSGVAYAADPSSHRVWRVDLGTGTKTVVAGTGEQGF